MDKHNRPDFEFVSDAIEHIDCQVKNYIHVAWLQIGVYAIQVQKTFSNLVFNKYVCSQ